MRELVIWWVGPGSTTHIGESLSETLVTKEEEIPMKANEQLPAEVEYGFVSSIWGLLAMFSWFPSLVFLFGGLS